jgi:hypothetical protein
MGVPHLPRADEPQSTSIDISPTIMVRKGPSPTELVRHDDGYFDLLRHGDARAGAPHTKRVVDHVHVHADDDDSASSHVMNGSGFFDINRGERLRGTRAQEEIIRAGLTACANETADPQTIEEAMRRADWADWKSAVEEEMNAHDINGTFKDAPNNHNCHPIGLKLVFKTKMKHGKIERYKARLVAQGFKQVEGIDYFNSFAPTIRAATLRMMFAHCALLGLAIGGLDVKTAFLIPDLPPNEIVVVRPPKWMIEMLNLPHGSLLALNKALYGIKQAAHLWYQHLKRSMETINLHPSPGDPCLFVNKCNNPSELQAIGVHVDDLTLIAPKDKLPALQKQVKGLYQTTGGERPDWLLGMRIDYVDEGQRSIALSQPDFSRTILNRFNMADCKAAPTPANDERLTAEMSPKNDQERQEMIKRPYRQLLGSLMYLATQTRPDIAFAVGQAARFAENPGPAHWTALKRIVRYVKGTIHLGLVYTAYDNNESLSPVGFSDSDWAGDPTTRRSVSGYIFTHAGAAISWRSHQQRSTALSSAEAELMAMTTAVQEAMWLRKVLRSMGYQTTGPTTIHEDNQSCIAMTSSPRVTNRNKHIDVRCFYVRERVEDGSINIEFSGTDKMAADFLTKAVSAAIIQRHSATVGLSNVSHSNIEEEG